ncbi:cobalamin-independent methionine synthase [Tilletiaria anomala UBC 951]|uniref:5-methyltetrahydropteroyltriglutamate--homocysteine S-methyltransferase n=1 Tax=Tilletiaria anomala (strain ATCC 24038 / CBS 436.72 / UBC 951) TaxID=1037660 RepID=A0A066V876_TILAU|nr:cobalamin-independent methionine synthase [Tilletiaria anomala UBC 951]KDN36488.1 cobalamin-independent methionine synthase [Tilletiaria anomala UBC 951]
MSVQSSVLGFPRIGPQREVKKALEAYWADKISVDELLKIAKEQRLLTYETIKSQGVDFVPTGTFSLYDHVLDFSATFNALPEAHANSGLSALDAYFAAARGHQKNGVDLPATEMKKWFDSNYHYLVPEFSENTQFKLNNTKPIDDFEEAKAAGYNARPVLLGPITYLWLGKAGKGASAGFDQFSLLSKLIPVYVELLNKLSQAGAEWIQIDEPILVMDAGANYAEQFKQTYTEFAKAAPSVKLMLATYFGRLDANINFVKDLPIAGLHIDLDRNPEQLNEIISAVAGTKIGLSLGLVSGRNIWKTDLAAAIKTAQSAIAKLGAERIVIATSSSLQHCPITITAEKKLKPEVLDWFSFATEKCAEVAVLAKALTNEASVADALAKNAASIKARRDFEKNSDPAVRQRLAAVKPEDLNRKSPFNVRKEVQQKVLDLPPFPTTTIGSFPQTKEIRVQRAKFNKGEIDQATYEKFIEDEIRDVVKRQEALGLDVLVHGEPERNDMSQYFGERLSGMEHPDSAWVQSFGSRYVRPPIIVADVFRPEPMTVRWSAFAQSLTKKTMKGMLTGPVTILNWSFPRVDVPRELQCKQIALALRDEVIDLEKAGIRAIQVDEPAIREGLPLRQKEWSAYFRWAVDSFKLATSAVDDNVNIASHFCYSDFQEEATMQSIIDLDADFVSIENSKSDAKLLKAFTNKKYPADIGPGVFDIHSPRVPTAEEMVARVREMTKYLGPHQIWVNPDCGLKTRTWNETTAQLENLVAAAKQARQEFSA